MRSRAMVIFDCDGVVIDSEIISARMLIEELKLYDVHLDLDYVAKHFLGRSYPVVLSQIRRDFGVELPDGFEADYRARLIRSFETNLRIMPGILSVLDGLKVPYCLATSSSPERVEQSLTIVGLNSYFADRITTASEVEHGKPAPDLFLHAASKWQRHPEECVVIEDSFAGIQAGLAAGMEVWHFTGGSHLAGMRFDDDERPKAHQQLASWDELFQLAPELKKGS